MTCLDQTSAEPLMWTSVLGWTSDWTEPLSASYHGNKLFNWSIRSKSKGSLSARRCTCLWFSWGRDFTSTSYTCAALVRVQVVVAREREGDSFMWAYVNVCVCGVVVGVGMLVCWLMCVHVCVMWCVVKAPVCGRLFFCLGRAMCKSQPFNSSGE